MSKVTKQQTCGMNRLKQLILYNTMNTVNHWVLVSGFLLNEQIIADIAVKQGEWKLAEMIDMLLCSSMVTTTP